MGDVFDRAEEGAEGCLVGRNVSLAAHTAIGIGGRVPLCLRPVSAEAAVHAVRLLRSLGIPFFVLGAGANVLVSDKGYDGAVLLTDKMLAVKECGGRVFAESGVRVGRLLRGWAAHGSGGLDFMAGIPASGGGAVFMNAGIARGHIGDRIVRVVALCKDGKIRSFDEKSCAFGYKDSVFMHIDAVILKAEIGFDAVGKESAAAAIEKAVAERKDLPKGKSMGCVFKNPPGFSAGARIERCGLKGAREGGAFVSPQHANFIINGGGASASEIRALAERVRDTVFRKTGVRLTEEIVYIGEF